VKVLPLLNGRQVISVVGTGKGSGKTTTVNFILSEGKKALRLGVTAFGLGGVQTLLQIPEGSLIALARNCEVTKKLELLDETDANSPWGNIVIGRTVEDCEAVIAGPVSLKDLIKIKEKFFALGCELMVVDSSLNRKSLSSAFLSQGVILSAGIDFPDRDSLFEEILSQVEMLTILEATSFPPSLNRHYAKKKEGWVPFSLEEVTPSSFEEVEEIFWPGAFLNEHANFLRSLDFPLSVIVEEPWHLFLTQSIWCELKKEGYTFKAASRTPLLLVTLNPLSSTGFSLDPRDFSSRASEMLKPVKVFDLLYE